MKQDLDSLMQARGVDALLVVGPGQHNSSMVYFTGGRHLTSAYLIQKRGQAPVLFHASMERDEAAKTGLRPRDINEFGFHELFRQFDGDLLNVNVTLLEKMFAEVGLAEGRVALSGQIDAGAALATFTALKQTMPGLEIVSDLNDPLLLRARATKDAAEIERIRSMGRVTTEVVAETADFLCSRRVQDGVLIGSDSQPVTIGDVKRRINLWLAERGAENPEDTIFAIGRDAGVPHSSGAPQDLLRLGQTLVFDIFPCEAGGGYFYDFTRTWCLGYAPDEALALYEDVREVYDQTMVELRLGGGCRSYQQRACELFEARGHATIRSDPKTESGYVHSLGHGLGLNIHEAPWLGLRAAETEVLSVGNVVTVEPGLYYPERGLGLRLEDTVWMRPDGTAEVLAPYPLDLVLPVRSA